MWLWRSNVAYAYVDFQKRLNNSIKQYDTITLRNIYYSLHGGSTEFHCSFLYTYKAIHYKAPSYLNCLINISKPVKTTCFEQIR